MSDVRPIDANALIKIVNNEKAPDWWKELIGGWIDSQPTLDAVPVEWIKAKIERLKSIDDEFASLAARTIQAMLNDYGADGERSEK